MPVLLYSSSKGIRLCTSGTAAAVRLSRKRNRRIRGDLEKDVLAPGERTTLEMVYRTRGLKKGDFSDALVLRADGKDLKPILLQGTIA